MAGLPGAAAWRALAVAVTGLALLASGCQTSGGGSDSGSENTVVTMYAGGSGQFTRNFNPFLPEANSGTRGMIYETLMFFNQAKADDVRPWLATDYSVSDNGREVTFDLREGVQWSDGEPFTSADVVFTLQLLKDNAKLNTTGLEIESAEAPDEHTVVVTMAEPVYQDLWYLAGQTWIVPEHVWSEVDDPGNYQNSEPVGTGGFVLDKFAAQNYLLGKNDSYWQQGKPAIGGMRFVSYSGNTSATNALAAGKVDWAGVFMPDVEQAFVSQDPEHHKYSTWDQLVINLMPNLQREPLDDVAVRKAVSLALDRKKINELAFAGYNKLPSLVETLIPRDRQYLAPEFKGVTPEYGPEKARQALTDAGYEEGPDGFFLNDDGEPLSIECLVISGYTDYISALQIIKENVQAAGIRFSSTEVSTSSFQSRRAQGDFQMIIDASGGGPSPYYLYNYTLNSNLTAPVGEDAANNWVRYRNDRVDELLDQMTRTDDEQAITEAAHRIQRIFAEDLPYIPLSQKASLVEYSTANVTGWPTEQNPYAIPVPYIQPDIGVVALNLKPTGSGE